MAISTSTDMGIFARARRLRLGWRQEDLAHRVGVSRQWVVDFEKGKPGARLDLVLRTLRELDALPLTMAGDVHRRRKKDRIIDRLVDGGREAHE